MAKTSKRKIIDKVLISFGVIVAAALIAIGGLTWWAYSFTSSNVHTELAAQKIYFPPLGSPALASPQIGPYLNQYAGKQLLTGPEAKAYANHFIAVHLSEVAGGQTYAQVSAASLADPGNTQLKQEAQTLFQGETLRGLLLGDAYAFATVGHIAEIAAIVCFATGGIMALLVLLGLWHVSTL
ncbi:MAG TPA: hypothetical protein VK712_01275 [Verrucomicrobiae bacterium]|jgi:hypothetical protein|nr:hypothetical protein [Verrucomicrobiae bacterium]